MTFWCLALRPDGEGDIGVDAVLRLPEAARLLAPLELRVRYNPDIHLVGIRLRANREPLEDKIIQAIGLLSADERKRLYNLPRKP